MKHRLWIAVVVAVLMLAPSACLICHSESLGDKADRVRLGLTLEEIRGILGPESYDGINEAIGKEDLVLMWERDQTLLRLGFRGDPPRLVTKNVWRYTMLEWLRRLWELRVMHRYYSTDG
jgi:hypothetical protein